MNLTPASAKVFYIKCSPYTNEQAVCHFEKNKVAIGYEVNDRMNGGNKL
jgi:hypothetical protein